MSLFLILNRSLHVIGLHSITVRHHDPLEPAAYFVVDDDWYVIQLLPMFSALTLLVRQQEGHRPVKH